MKLMLRSDPRRLSNRIKKATNVGMAIAFVLLIVAIFIGG